MKKLFISILFLVFLLGCGGSGKPPQKDSPITKPAIQPVVTSPAQPVQPIPKSNVFIWGQSKWGEKNWN